MLYYHRILININYIKGGRDGSVGKSSASQSGDLGSNPGGVLTWFTQDKIEALSKMPSRDELIGRLLRTWMAAVTNFTIGLDALRVKKEEESA